MSNTVSNTSSTKTENGTASDVKKENTADGEQVGTINGFGCHLEISFFSDIFVIFFLVILSIFLLGYPFIRSCFIRDN